MKALSILERPRDNNRGGPISYHYLSTNGLPLGQCQAHSVLGQTR
jgi:hypothetical protein